MSAEFRQSSHRESGDEIIHVPEEEETLQENNLPEHEFKSTTVSTDHNNPGSMKCSDGANPAPPYQQAMDEREPEANDYESLGEGNPAYDYIEAVSCPLTLRNRAWAKCRKTMLFLVPIFASQIVNVLAGLFYMSFLFVDKTNSGVTSYEDGEMVAKEQRIFRVSFALAAASCAPLLVRFSARKIAQWGSVLLIFSCILLSLTTTGDVMTILLSITAGFTGGLLRTTGVVSTVDHLNTRPALALIISYISFLIGKVIIVSCSFYIYQFNAVRRSTQTYGSVVFQVHIGRDWPHVMRVFEIMGVIGLLAGIFLQKNSQAQHNVTRLFKHPPIYFLILITVPASMGLSIRTNASNHTLLMFGSLLVLFVLLIIPGKESLKEKSALLSMGISVLAEGLVTMVQSSFKGEVAMNFLLGAAIGLHQVLMPLVLINTTGRSNIKLALPVLVCFGEVGGLLGISIIEKQSDRVALYFAGVSLIIAGVGAIIAWVLIKRWPPLSDDNFSRAISICAETTGEEEEENVVVECVEDRVEEEEADNPGEEEAEEPGQEEAEVPVVDLREGETENSG
ncbi:uncharacterized protein LOC124134666 [Haliotis rufescens]|uniref:uncharacterized protein LOC124134666 n=1 Tax=Haliotis rufescens TaxID=6454 RepID=UPI00201F2733|nr:uncharacterized protein LOC124134666 [Haliotis rufescens]